MAYNTEIGRIVTRWAYLEFILRLTLYRTLEIGPKQGRISVREPRAAEVLDMISDLITIEKLPIQAKFKSLRKSLEKLQKFRDALAHGTWMKVPELKNPVLQMRTGSFPIHLGGPSVKARITPRGREIEIETLRLARDAIERTTEQIQKLQITILRARAASRDKSPAQKPQE